MIIEVGQYLSRDGFLGRTMENTTSRSLVSFIDEINAFRLIHTGMSKATFIGRFVENHSIFQIVTTHYHHH